MAASSSPTPDNKKNGSIISSGLRKERVNARWSILRNALLQKSSSSSAHSIHRFPGYQLLRPETTDTTSKQDVARIMDPLLKTYDWNPAQSLEENLHQLEIAILALGCCKPKGCCLQVQGFPEKKDTKPSSWIIDTLKQNCRSSVNLQVVDESTDLLTLLVQEGSSTKYNSCQYRLDDTCSLWTREPRETKLSLEDLVSHRTTGVDNTGNICVWDSERTLAYLLYHHFKDLDLMKRPRSILELGTGMAGLAAISLGLRIVQLEEDINDDDEQHPRSEYPIQVTLTDGHAEGVKNNLVNQYLTRVFANTATSDDDDERHPYKKLDVSAKVLLWTTDLSPATTTKKEVSDVVLVSDCTHFQNFHAALAITTLRSLRVGGTAIFCQPQRGDSLENFCTLLKVPTTIVGLLASLEWKTHPLLEEQHLRALKEKSDVYDPNLHQPKLLLVTKLRELTEEDCQAFVAHQKERDVK
jgi:hypothetical protein